MIKINKKLTYIIPALLLVLATGTVFAAKPTEFEHNGKAYGITGLEKEKAVTHVYFYDHETGTEEPEYDYETLPWGKMNANKKTAKVNFTAHNLNPDTTYDLYSGETLVGSKMANEYGDVHIKGDYVDAESVSLWTLREGEETQLTGSDLKIKHLGYEMDEEAD